MDKKKINWSNIIKSKDSISDEDNNSIRRGMFLTGNICLGSGEGGNLVSMSPGNALIISSSKPAIRSVVERIVDGWKNRLDFNAIKDPDFLLQEITDMNKIYEFLKHSPFNSVNEYNSSVKDPLAFIGQRIIIVNWKDLSEEDRDHAGSIARLGRAAGFHIIIIYNSYLSSNVPIPYELITNMLGNVIIIGSLTNHDNAVFSEIIESGSIYDIPRIDDHYAGLISHYGNESGFIL
jgi:hypothetical protein